MQRLNILHGISVAPAVDDEVVYAVVVALRHANPEVSVGEGGEVVGDVDVLFGHVDDEVGHGKLADLFLFFCLEHFHEPEVLCGYLAVLVAEQYVIGGFLGDDDEPDPADAEQRLDAFFDVTNRLLVEVLQDDDDRAELLKVGHAASVFLRDELSDGAVKDSISQFVEHGLAKN